MIKRTFFFTHLIIIIKSEVLTFPSVVIFSSYPVSCYIWSQEGWVLLSLQQSSPWCVWINGYIMAWRLFSFICCILRITLFHYHHYVDSSEDIGHIKWLSDIFCHACVCHIKSSLSVIFYAYMGLCVLILPISLLMIERIFALDHIIMIKWEIKNNASFTVNDDSWVTSDAICQWFSQVSWVTGIVMSYSSIILTHANWHKGDLH